MSHLVLIALSILLVGGCGPGETRESARPDAGVRAAPPPDWNVSGQYLVTGVTTDRREGTQRPIAGQLVLTEEGGRFTTHFELMTSFPGSNAAAAKVVGSGGGEVDGWNLSGTAQTQLVLAAVPNVDVGFAYVPRRIGPRIVSSAEARFFEDGTVRFEIENQPAEGEDYAPTHTTLVGFRP